MRKVNGYWVDENYNAWDCKLFTEEQANEESFKLTNCHKCINCTDCDRCDGCFDCHSCAGCNNCIGCSNCNGCVYCFFCDNCGYCHFCKECISAFAFKHQTRCTILDGIMQHREDD
jgi:hypothetical protein